MKQLNWFCKEESVLSPKSFIGNPKEVRGNKVLKIERFAKLLAVNLGEVNLLFHLKMTGQLILQGESVKREGERYIGGHPTEDMMGKMPNSHTRVIFSFSDGSKLYFNDQRRFGWVKIIDNGKLTIDNLGPEPLEKEFNWQILKKNLLKHKSQPVKVVLMDQSVVSGVGNIYSNEACFNAKIDPRTKVSNLSNLQFKRLHLGVLKSLRDGIAHGGSTRAHFRDPEGHKGYFLDYAYVYGLDKHPCKVCKTIIKKIQLGGRGTYYCSNCQK
ncbi:MAG: formamidopyrimidine-DNA glycosylase [Candidatus Daviesbacteria bacterium GW2011_GWF2_38_6]|uniref:Formamidopyrimidine-DNA glycosylase n=1 Tax=Candidatus Daviesbacteria bacterium GW2011_GWF2_38_6 TaxID=1618432 RepID=A0A0G0KGM6_9BACT|nr:MAG: formamidopyrimidine-DNA glycosylase [Candidatus Daviesbacteria bacterium GW2011_GWF2_38_6]